MKHNPISFNVVRQALAWGNLPQPSLNNDASGFDPDVDENWAVYIAEWPIPAIEKCFSDDKRPHGWNIMLWLRLTVNSCLCEDINFLSAHLDFKRDMVVARLKVIMPSNDDGYEEMLDQIEQEGGLAWLTN
jgi:hypothetical protein